MNDGFGNRQLGAETWYHFSYLTRGHSKREVTLHQPRDAMAALCLVAPLAAHGYAFGGQILNYPLAAPPAGGDIPLDTSFLRAGALLVLTTRPALDDLRDGIRRCVERSYTTLESAVYARIRRDFSFCNRARVAIADRHVGAHPGVARLCNAVFRQNGGAAVKSYLPYGARDWVEPPRGPGFTLAYLVYAQQAWKGGPGLLASFGMNGLHTLIWNHYLATSGRHLVCTAPFVMAAIDTPAKIPRADTLADLAGAFNVRLLTTAAEAIEA